MVMGYRSKIFVMLSSKLRKTSPSILVNGKAIEGMGEAAVNGRMEVSMMGTGRMIRRAGRGGW